MYFFLGPETDRSKTVMGPKQDQYSIISAKDEWEHIYLCTPYTKVLQAQSNTYKQLQKQYTFGKGNNGNLHGGVNICKGSKNACLKQ